MLIRVALFVTWCDLFLFSFLFSFHVLYSCVLSARPYGRCVSTLHYTHHHQTQNLIVTSKLLKDLLKLWFVRYIPSTTVDIIRFSLGTATSPVTVRRQDSQTTKHTVHQIQVRQLIVSSIILVPPATNCHLHSSHLPQYFIPELRFW